VDAVEEEAFEDLQRTVGAGADETPLSSVYTVVARRLPWLLLNLVTTFVAATIVGLFESVIARVTAVAVLLPVVAGQAGNSGAQSLAVVLRGLALDEVNPGIVWRVLRKELIAGAINGLAVAIVCGGGVWLWSGSIALAMVIGASMWLCLVLSPLIGAGIPIALQRCGLDPAQSSTIFLTTFTEVAGFGLFLGFAALCVRWLV
jgi:magnesium transporter